MKLADIIELFIPGDWGNEDYSSETPNNVYCIRGADVVPISNHSFCNIPLRYVSDRTIETKLLKEGDLVIEKSGGSPTQSTGRIVYISKDLIEKADSVVCSNFCTAIRVKSEWNPLYVYCYWQNIYNRGVFFNFEGKTSGIKNLQIDNALSAIEIECLPLDEQNKIANILSKFDSKIAINRQINDNLEAMAKQLYDYWFVQFDFPNEEGKPYKSSGGKMIWNEKLKREIPEKWEILPIYSILDKVKSTPRLTTDEYMTIGQYPIIDQTVNIYHAGFTDRKDAVVRQFPAVIFGDHSCAVKYVNFPFVRGADGTQVMLSKDERISVEYLYFATKIIPLKEGYARHFSLLKESFIIIPCISIAKEYKEIASNLFRMITYNRKNIITLSKQRDELLPLLMNGQVSVNSD